MPTYCETLGGRAHIACIMEHTEIERAISCIVSDSEPFNKQPSTSDDGVSRYAEAAKRLSYEIRGQSRKSLEQVIQECSNSGANNPPWLGNDTTRDATINVSKVATHLPGSISITVPTVQFPFQEPHEMEWHTARPPAKFPTRGQSRPGSRHGKGGRMPGTEAQVRKHYSKYPRCVIRKRLYCLITKNEQDSGKTECLENNADVTTIEVQADDGQSEPAEEKTSPCQKLIEELSSRIDIPNFDITQYTSESVRRKILKEHETSADEHHPSSVEHLPSCTLGQTAKFSKSDSVLPRDGQIFNSRERHIVNTWLDKEGHVRCTCIGSTQYEIFSLNNGFRHLCCAHAEAFSAALTEIFHAAFGNCGIPFQVLYNAFAEAEPQVLQSGVNNVPLFRKMHRGKSVVLICNDVSGDNQLCWVPIRRVLRSGGRYLCAFCDMINTNRCHHVTEISNINKEVAMTQVEELPSDREGIDAEFGEPLNQNECKENEESPRRKNTQPLSFLPVAPVNCPTALRVDQQICELVQQNEVFKVVAPPLCIYCQAPGIETTRSANTSGLIMCSIGACAMEIDTIVCSGCRKEYSAEGRQQGIFVDSVCLAAPQKLLRDQLIGFALGNGTLSSRLDQFHSQVAAYEDAKLFQNQRPRRSSRKLYDLCISFVRLMVCEPEISLFSCATCQRRKHIQTEGKKGRPTLQKVPDAICVDGIWAGYLKKYAIPFENVSEPCNPIPSFSRSVKKASLH